MANSSAPQNDLKENQAHPRNNEPAARKSLETYRRASAAIPLEQTYYSKNERCLLVRTVKRKVLERRTLARGYLRLLRQLLFAFLYVSVLILQADVGTSSSIEVGIVGSLDSWAANDGTVLADVHDVDGVQMWLAQAVVPNMFFETAYNDKAVFVLGVSGARYINDRLRVGLGLRITVVLWPDSFLQEETPALYPYPFMDLQVFTDRYCVDAQPGNVPLTVNLTTIFATENPCAPRHISAVGVALLNAYSRPLLYNLQGSYNVILFPYMPLSYIQRQVAFLQTMGFFNNRTRTVRISSVFTSEFEQATAMFDVRFDFDAAGYCSPKTLSLTITLPYVRGDGTWPTKNVIRLCLEGLFVLSLFFQIYVEIRQIRNAYQRSRKRRRKKAFNRLYGIRQDKEGRDGDSPDDDIDDMADSDAARGLNIQGRQQKPPEDLSAYFSSFWNWLDWTYIFVSLGCLGLWAALVLRIYALDRFRWETRKFTIKYLEEHPEIYFFFYDTLKTVAQMRKYYLFTSGINLCVCFFRTLQYFSFHKQLSFLNTTINRTFKGLFNFLFVFITLLLGFATFAHICFGHRLEDFSSMERSLLSLYLMIVEQRNYLDEFLISEGNDQFGMVLARLLSVFFSVTMAIILINVFLAIVLDASDVATSNRSGRRKTQSSFLKDLVLLLEARLHKNHLVQHIDKRYRFAQVSDSVIRSVMESFHSDKRTVTALEVSTALTHLLRHRSPTNVHWMTDSIFREFHSFTVEYQPMQPLPFAHPVLQYPSDFASVRSDLGLVTSMSRDVTAPVTNQIDGHVTATSWQAEDTMSSAPIDPQAVNLHMTVLASTSAEWLNRQVQPSHWDSEGQAGSDWTKLRQPKPITCVAVPADDVSTTQTHSAESSKLPRHDVRGRQARGIARPKPTRGPSGLPLLNGNPPCLDTREVHSRQDTPASDESSDSSDVDSECEGRCLDGGGQAPCVGYASHEDSRHGEEGG